MHSRKYCRAAQEKGAPRWRPQEEIQWRIALTHIRLIGAAALNGRNLGAHGAQIGGELAAVVDAVIVDEAEVEHRRHVERTQEINGRAKPLGRHFTDTA